MSKWIKVPIFVNVAYLENLGMPSEQEETMYLNTELVTCFYPGWDYDRGVAVTKVHSGADYTTVHMDIENFKKIMHE